MNSEAVGSLIRKILISVLSALAAKYHLDNNTAVAIATDLADLAVIGWGVWAHWGMKKVPETATVIPDPQQSRGG